MYGDSDIFHHTESATIHEVERHTSDTDIGVAHLTFAQTEIVGIAILDKVGIVAVYFDRPFGGDTAMILPVVGVVFQIHFAFGVDEGFHSRSTATVSYTIEISSDIDEEVSRSGVGIGIQTKIVQIDFEIVFDEYSDYPVVGKYDSVSVAFE
jgi:hypothetical protein